MKRVDIYTDGACSGNPGPGGWACILVYQQNRKELYGGCEFTTNNRMELTAAIEGLRVLKEPCDVNIYTDSAYFASAVGLGWIKNWVRNGWVNSSNKPVENQDLWKDYLNLAKTHNVMVFKVRGHSDVELNNECDRLAKRGIKELLKSNKCDFVNN